MRSARQDLLQHLGTFEGVDKLHNLRDPRPVLRKRQVPDHLNRSLGTVDHGDVLRRPQRSYTLDRVDGGPGNLLADVVEGLELDRHLRLIVRVGDLLLEELRVSIDEGERAVAADTVIRKDRGEERCILCLDTLCVVLEKLLDCLLQGCSHIDHGGGSVLFNVV